MQKIVARAVGLILFFLLCFTQLPAQEPDTSKGYPFPKDFLYSPAYIRSGASLGYLFSDDINLIGLFSFDFPLVFRNEKSAFLNLRLCNSATKVENDVSFRVKDIDYQITLGARDYLTKKLIVSAFVSQQGTEQMDAEGSPFIRFFGFSIESSDYRDFRSQRGLYWRGEVGGIFKSRDVDGEITFKGDVRYNILSTEKLTYGADFRIDSLINDFNTSNDWWLGPRITFCPSCSNAPSVFLYYLNSGHPLGIGDSGFFLGFDYREKIGDDHFAVALPEIDGNVSAGIGQGREMSRFSLKLRSPLFRKPTDFRLVFDFDTNFLTGDDTGNLYYFLTGGLERERKNLLQGVYFYHRSNHQLAEPNDDVTFLNVLELGLSSRGWEREDIHEGFRMDVGPQGKRAVLNFQARAGYLFNSTFGEERRWNLKGGMRIDLPLPSLEISPFLLAYWEGGDATRKEISLGLRTPLDFDVQVQYRKDDQYFGQDDDAFLLISSLYF